ncbi:DnaB-like helicase C-terminal domain-containing protein [Photobacterium swingsii]|uniref:DnaB-like helicase C-terminal domain-containing protein n=1 Tax=Photobacterium swingsii TaxID=680026 RepID=UPI00352E14B4
MTDKLLTMEAALESVLMKLESKYQEPEPSNIKIDAFSTGYIDLDKKIGGLGKGLTVISGRPMHGADVLQRNILENIVMEQGPCGSKVLHFETNTDTDYFYQRVLSSLGRVDFSDIQLGQLDDEAWARISSTMGLLMGCKNLIVCDKPKIYIEDIEKICDEVIKEHGGLATISFSSLQSICTRKKCDTRYAEVSEASRFLKYLSLKYDTRVIVTSNLNRNLEQRADKRPLLWDLRDSGSIEEDADVILFCYRDEVYNEESSFINISEVIISKNNFSSGGIVHLTYVDNFSRFDNYAGPSLVDINETL